MRSDDDRLTFSLRHLANYESAGDADKAVLLDSLYNLSQMKWEYIRGMHESKFEPRDVEVSLPPDVGVGKDLMIFRLMGTRRAAIGYREGPIFYVLWLDLDFKPFNEGCAWAWTAKRKAVDV